MYRLVVNNTDIISNCNNISWSSSKDALGTQLQFDSIKEIPVGTVAQLFNGSNIEIFRGIALKPTMKRWTWSYVYQDYSFYLNRKIPIKQFNGITASEAITSLLGEVYLNGVIVEIPTIIDKIYSNKTRIDIIKDILDIAKNDQGYTYIQELEGNIFYVRKLYDMKISPKIMMPREINIEISMENMANKITVISGNNDDAIVQATAEDTSQQWFYGVLDEVETVDADNAAQAQNIANNKLSELNKISYKSTFEVVAIENGDLIKANRIINLQVGKRLNGYYNITNATHTLNKGLHKVNITIEW